MTEVTCLCLRPEYLLGVQEQYLQWDCIPRGNTLDKAPFPPSKQQLSSFFSFFSFFPLSFLLATTSWGISIRKEKRMSAFISWSTPLQKKKKNWTKWALVGERLQRGSSPSHLSGQPCASGAGDSESPGCSFWLQSDLEGPSQPNLPLAEGHGPHQDVVVPCFPAHFWLLSHQWGREGVWPGPPWSPGSQSREQEMLKAKARGSWTQWMGRKTLPGHGTGRESEWRTMHQKHKRKRWQCHKPEDRKPVWRAVTPGQRRGQGLCP